MVLILLLQEVVNGNAHGMISSAPKPRFWSDAYPGKVFLPFGDENLTKGDEAFALRKGDHDALNFFSNWITSILSNFMVTGSKRSTSRTRNSDPTAEWVSMADTSLGTRVPADFAPWETDRSTSSEFLPC